MIHKNSVPIETLSDWKTLGKPKRASHWVPERSAFETAREWLDVTSPALPPGILAALQSNAAFGDVLSWCAEPEVRIRIDGFRGEPRNCDLVLKGRDQFGDFVLAVEAKADEPFGKTVENTLSSALKRLAAKPASKGVERITGLAQSLFGTRQSKEPAIGSLRYQLLTATAGAIAASTNGCRTVMLVQEFKTGKTDANKHAANGRDLDAFVYRLSRGAVERCEPGILYGPILLPQNDGNAEEGSAPPLFIGKVVHDRTNITADEAVRIAMRTLGGERSIDEVADWIETNLAQQWKDVGTTMADMTTSENSSTGYPSERQVLERVEPGVYKLRD